MDLTIVIPVYNEIKNLKSLFVMLNQQQSSNVHIIFVDDCSIDGSTNKLKEFVLANEHCSLICNKSNLGIMKSCLVGLKKVKTELVFFLSANDKIDPNFCAENIIAHRECPDAGFSFCIVAIENQFSKKHSKLHSAPFHETGYVSAQDYTKFIRTTHFNIPSNSIVYKYKYLSFLNDGINKYGLYADWFISQRVALEYGFFYIQKKLATFVLHKGAYSLSGRHHYLEKNKYISTILDDVSDQPALKKIFVNAALFPENKFRFLLPILFDKHKRWLFWPVTQKALASFIWRWMMLNRLPNNIKNILRRSYHRFMSR